MVTQNIRTTLNQDYAGADAPKKLGEFAGDDAAAKDDDALGNEIQIEHIVARPEGRLGKSGQRRRADSRACGD